MIKLYTRSIRHLFFLAPMLFMLLLWGFDLSAQREGMIYAKLKVSAQNPSTIRAQFKERHPGFGIQWAKPALRLPSAFTDSPEAQAMRQWQAIRLDSVQKLDELVAQMRESGQWSKVEKAPERKLDLTVPPNDPHYVDWPTTPNNWHLYQINAAAAWSAHTGTDPVVLAVIDDGVRVTHQDLSPVLWTNPYEVPGNGVDDDGNGYVDDVNGWDAAEGDNDANPLPDLYGHGTHVAGCALAATNNNVGVASIAYNTTKLLPIKVKNSGQIPDLSLDAATKGMVYAVETYLYHLANQNANYRMVVNMSLGSDDYSSFEQDLVNFGVSLGMVFVASAGNDNVTTESYPAAYDNVIAVAASDPNDKKASFSNYGSWVDITAPGTSIHSCDISANNVYADKQGTSMSCPIVSGAVGLLLSNNNSLTPLQVESCIKSSATNIDALNPSYAGQLGAGRLDAQALINCGPTSATILDAAMADVVLSPIDPSTCAPNVQAAVSVTNQGQTTLTSFDLTYQWDAALPVTTNISPVSITQGATSLTLLPNQPLGPGAHTLTVFVSNPNGATDRIPSNDTIVREFTVTNSAWDLNSAAFLENFESGSFSTNYWEVSNPDKQKTFEVVTTAGNPSGGTQSAGMDIYNQNFFTNERDALISRTLYVPASTDSTTELRFRHAYRNYNLGQDVLQVSVSTNCGLSFDEVIYSGGPNAFSNFDDFATNDDISTSFVPSSSADWSSTATTNDFASFVSALNLDDFRGQNIRLKFEVINGPGHSGGARNGNNLYLDDILVQARAYQPTCKKDGDTLNQFSGTIVGSSFTGTNPGTSYYTDASNQFFYYGHTDQADRARAERFSGHIKYNEVLGFDAYFENTGAPSAAPSDIIRATVWDNDGVNGGPGTVLASKDISLTSIYTDIAASSPTEVRFPSPVSISGDFYVGFRFVYPTTGRVGLLGNAPPDCNTPTASWRQTNSGSWYTMRSYTGKINHRIYPIVSHSEATLYKPDSITGPAQPCAGDTVDYQVTDSGYVYTWTLPTSWTLVSGQGSSVVSVVPDNAAGTLSVVAEDGSCQSNPSQRSINPLNQPAQPTAISNLTGGSMCEGAVKDFGVTPVAGMTYSWDLPAGWAGSSTSHTISATLGATGTIRVWAVNGNGCKSPVRTLNVSTTPGSSLGSLSAISGPTSVCEDGSFSYSVATLAGAVSYTWSVPSGWSIDAGQGSTTIDVTPSGNAGTINVVASNGSGTCPSTASQSLTITDVIRAPLGISGPTSVCVGTNYTYSTPAISGASTYNWSLPAGWAINSGAGTNTISVTAGSNTGMVSVTAGNGSCVSPAAHLNVGTVVDQPGAISGPTTPCPYELVTYSVPAVAGASSYTWSLPSGWAGTSTTNSITAATDTFSGTVQVVAHGAGCSSPAQTLSVTVNPLPQPPNGALYAERCPGTSQKLSPTPLNNPSGGSITWDLPSGWSIAGGPNDHPDVNISDTGGTVRAYVTSGGCESQRVSWTVNVNKPQNPDPIQGPTNVCGGVPVTYEATAVPGAVGYEWIFPAGWSPASTATTTQFVDVLPGGSGGNIRVRAYNGSCYSDYVQSTVSFSGSTPPAPSVSGPNNFCAFRGNLMYVASSSPTPQTWEWSLEPGLQAAGWEILSGASDDTVIVRAGNVNATNTSNFRFRVRAFTSGCASSYRNVNVSLRAVNPTDLGMVQYDDGGTWVNADGTTIGCPNSAIRLRAQNTASTTGGGSVLYDWELPAGWQITAGYGTRTIDVQTTDQIGPVRVWARNDQCPVPWGRSDTASANPVFEVSPDPIASIAGPDKVCANTSYTFTVPSDPNASSYNWTYPAGWTVLAGAGTNSIILQTDGTPTVGDVTAEAVGTSCTSNTAILTVEELQIGTSLVPSYNLTATTESFTYLSGGTFVQDTFSVNMGSNTTDGSSDLTAFTDLAAGFDFNFSGEDVDSLVVNENGFVFFPNNGTDQDFVTSSYYYSTYGLLMSHFPGNAAIDDPFNSDYPSSYRPEVRRLLVPFGFASKASSSASSGVRYQVVGSAPNRYLAIEWRGMNLDSRYFGNETSATTGSEVVSFQLRLYESSHSSRANHIEFLYRREGSAPSCGCTCDEGLFGDFYPYAEIGLANEYGYQILDTTTASPSLQTGNTFSDQKPPKATAGCGADMVPASNTKYILAPPVSGPTPLNDLCANAEPLTLRGPGACDTIVLPAYDTDGATASGPGAPACWSGGKTNEVWFSLTKPSGVVSLDISTDFNLNCTPSPTAGTAIEVFEGSCGSLTQVECSDDNGSNNPLTANAMLTGLDESAQTYWIRVVNDDLETDKFGICVEELPRGCDQPDEVLTSDDTYYTTFMDCPSENVFGSEAQPSCASSSYWTDKGQYIVSFTTLTDNEEYNIGIAIDNNGFFEYDNWDNSEYEIYVLDQCPTDASYSPSSSCIDYYTSSNSSDYFMNDFEVLFPTAGEYFLVFNRKGDCSTGDDAIIRIGRIYPSISSSCNDPVEIPSLPYNASYSTCGAGDDHRGTGTVPNSSYPELVELDNGWSGAEEIVFRYLNTEVDPVYIDAEVLRGSPKSYVLSVFGPFSSPTCPSNATTAPTKNIYHTYAGNGGLDNGGYQIKLDGSGYYYFYVQANHNGAPPHCGAFDFQVRKSYNFYKEVPEHVFTQPAIGIGNQTSTGPVTSCSMSDKYNSVNATYYGSSGGSCGGINQSPSGDNWIRAACGWEASFLSDSIFEGLYTFSPSVSRKYEVKFGPSTNLGRLAIFSDIPLKEEAPALLAEGEITSPVWNTPVQFDSTETYYFLYSTNDPATPCDSHEIILEDAGPPDFGNSCGSAITIPSLLSGAYEDLGINSTDNIAYYEPQPELQGGCFYHPLGKNDPTVIAFEVEAGTERVYRYVAEKDGCVRVSMNRVGDLTVDLDTNLSKDYGFSISRHCVNDSTSKCLGLYAMTGSQMRVEGTFTVEQGEEYFIYMHSDTTIGPPHYTNNVDFRVEYCDQLHPTNDFPCTAELVAPGEMVLGTTEGARDDGLPPSSCMILDGVNYTWPATTLDTNRWDEINSVWYKFVAPSDYIRLVGQSETIGAIDDRNSTFTMAVYRGDCNNLTEITASCDNTSRQDLCYVTTTPQENFIGRDFAGVTEGETLYLRVEANGNNQGAFSFRVMDMYKLGCIEDFQDAPTAKRVYKSPLPVTGGTMGQGQRCDAPYWSYAVWGKSSMNNGDDYEILKDAGMMDFKDKSTVWLKFQINSTPGTTPLRFTIKTPQLYPNDFDWALFRGNPGGTFNEKDWDGSSGNNLVNTKMPGEGPVRASNAWYYISQLPRTLSVPDSNWGGLGNFDNDNPAAAPWNDVTQDLAEWGSEITTGPITHSSPGPINGLQSHTVNPTGLNEFENANNWAQPLSVSANEWYYLLIDFADGNGAENFEVDFHDSPINYDCGPQPDTLQWVGVASSNWFEPMNWVDPHDLTQEGCFLPDANTVALVTASSPKCGGAAPPFWPQVGDTATFGKASASNLVVEAGAECYVSNHAVLELEGDLEVANATDTRFLAAENAHLRFVGDTAQELLFGGLTEVFTLGNVAVLNTDEPVVNSGGNLDLDGSLFIANGATFDGANVNLTLGGDFRNFGTYLNTPGLLMFDGLGVDQFFVNTDASLELNNVTIHKASHPATPNLLDTLYLENELTMAGGSSVLDLSRGIVKVRDENHQITIRDNGAVNAVQNYGDSSFVIGYLQRRIAHNVSYAFPVGLDTTGYQLAEVDFSDRESVHWLKGRARRATFIASPLAVKSECPTANNLANVLNNGFWDIEAYDNSGSQITNQGRYDITLHPQNYSNPEAYQTVAKNGVLAGDFNVQCSALPIVRRLSLRGFSAFSIAQASYVPPVALPLHVLDLNAQGRENHIEVDWVSIEEQEVAGYAVERGLPNQAFEEIRYVEAKETGALRNSYAVRDYDVRPGITYRYRLRQLDEDGDFGYTRSVSARLNDENAFRVRAYPNPFRSELQLDIEASEGEELEIYVVNVVGKTVLHQRITTEQAFTEMKLSTATWAKGYYQILVYHPDGFEALRMIKSD